MTGQDKKASNLNYLCWISIGRIDITERRTDWDKTPGRVVTPIETH
jgi:hypothetical protein